jgi:hypothetical protein
MKTYGGVDACIAHFLDLGTSWRWVVSFTPGERAPGTHWIGGWVDPRSSLHDVEKRKFLTLSGLELVVHYIVHTIIGSILYSLRSFLIIKINEIQINESLKSHLKKIPEQAHVV